MYPINVVAQHVRSALRDPQTPVTPAASPGFPVTGISNAPTSTTTWMAGMPLYASAQRDDTLCMLSLSNQLLIEADVANHGENLNNPDLLFIVDNAHAAAHAEYRALCQALEKPGRYCIRRSGGGGYMLVHRARGGLAPQLKCTPLKFSAHGWQLMVPDGARSAWDALRDRSFPALEVLKANLPRGMQEATDVSLQATRL